MGEINTLHCGGADLLRRRRALRAAVGRRAEIVTAHAAVAPHRLTRVAHQDNSRKMLVFELESAMLSSLVGVRALRALVRRKIFFARARNLKATNPLNPNLVPRALLARLPGIALAMGLCCLPEIAHAAVVTGIFVANANGFGAGSPGTVGRYDLAGSVVTNPMITGLDVPFGIAASSTNLYVSNNNTGAVGEYTLTGSPVNSSLFNVSGVTGLTVSGSNLYVSSQSDNTIKLYNTAGTLLNGSFITGVNGPRQVAVLGSFVFVANNGNGTIGEYTTSGNVVNASLISGLNSVTGIAVSEDGANLFVADQGAGTVGKYTTTGAPVNASLITGVTPEYLAVLGSNLYVDNFNGNIGQYNTSGAVANASLISGLNEPLSFAVVPEPSALAFVAVAIGSLAIRRRSALPL